MAEMTSAQRVATAGQGVEPDRVPVAGMGMGYIWAHLYGPDSMLEYGRDAKKMAGCMVYACKELGFDLVGTFLDSNMIWEAIAEASKLYFPATYWKGFVAQAPHRLHEGDPIKDIHYGNPVIKTMKDALKLVPADPHKHGRLPVVLEAIKLANQELKGDWIVSGSYGISYDMGCLMGWTQMLMAMEKDLPFWRAAEEIAIETNYQFAKAQIEAGAMGLAALTQLPQFVGSEAFSRKPVWIHADHPPELAERLFKEFGVGTALHPCTRGSFEPGIEAWKKWLDHTPAFAMPEYGGAEALARAKKELAPATIQGNLDPVDIMVHGSPEEVDSACKELIKKCAPGGRFVLAPGCDVAVNVPMENIKAMVDSVKKYGYYPIQVNKL